MQLDQAVHLTVRMENRTTHIIQEKTFPGPTDWNDDVNVRSVFKPVMQIIRRRVGSLTIKEHYTAEEEQWMRTYVTSRPHIDWSLPKGQKDPAWRAFWAAYQSQFPIGRAESGVWTKTGPGSSRLNLMRQKGMATSSIAEQDEVEEVEDVASAIELEKVAS